MSETTSNYIFRIHDDGASDIRIECWGRSVRLDGNKINTIKDVERKGASKVATSVPSPFARMHLFETSFKEVENNLEGDSIYHQIVSDCLDVFQFLFNSGNNNPDIRFKQWNRQQRLDALRTAPQGHPHHLLADSLELFFTGKFADTEDITLIYYKGILMGGTSPLTVFFTSPNWQREMDENGIVISSTTGNDTFFDKDYMPLYQRDPLFVEFMWKFYLAHRNILNSRCEDFAGYIRKSIETYRKDLAKKANDEWADYINNPAKLDSEYQKLNVTPNSSIYLQTNGFFAYSVKSGGIPAKIHSESDFLCIPTSQNYKYELDHDGNLTNPNVPLVLAKGMNVPGTYTYDNTPWSPNTDIRRASIIYTDGSPIPLAQRFLPGNSQIQYPFITTEDFLEDKLVKLPFKLNSEKFFTGYSGDFNFLLPVKKQYFNFFTKDDLKKNLEIIPTETKVTVKLKIPVRNKRGLGFITFSKDYEFDKTLVANFRAGLGIFPFYKVMDNNEVLQKLNDYTILFSEKNDAIKIDGVDYWQTSAVALQENGEIQNKEGCIVIKRSIDVDRPQARTNKGITAGSYYYKVKSAFDLIEFNLSDEANRRYTGLIIPLFKEVYQQNATRNFTFAIDFGTSNSHIAYNDLQGDKKAKTFEIGEPDMQMVLLNKPGESKVVADKYATGFGDFPEVGDFVNREFVPPVIGRDSGSSIVFPIRTATFEKGSFEAEKPDLFTNINVGFYLDSDGAKPHDCEYHTNLKWLFENSGNTSDPHRIEAFLKGLMLLVRNKIIMNGGNVRETKIAWLIPLSMKQRSIDLFAVTWQKVFDEVFHGACQKPLEQITESVAPYFYLKNNTDANVKDFADALNIDIGGGTTDVMFFMRKTSTYISSSFRFAGNDIWGSGFNRNEKDNGFLKNYVDFKKRNKQAVTAEDNIFESFMRDPALTSEDVASLLFRYDKHFNFAQSINRDKPALKLIFFLHYSAIIYHLVQLIESKQLNVPRYFTFTGKGSQYISTMCSRESLTRFTKILIAAYTKQEIPTDFKVVLTDNPKEATANGAVLFVTSPEKDRILKEDIKIEYQWGSEIGYAENFRRNITRMKDISASADFHVSVLRNLQNFVETTLHNEDVIEFFAQYEITNLGIYEEFLTRGDVTKGGGIYDSYNTVLKSLTANDSDTISETFFFLGFKDALYFLSKFIIEQP